MTPDFRAQIIGVLSETMGTKAEFNALLQELKEMRIETGKRFQELREDFQNMRLDFEKRFEQIDRRFEQVDSRFERMDSRFNQVDSRFDQVDRRFEQVDSKFDQVDSRFEQVDRKLNELIIGVGSLGGRTGKPLEDVIRQVIEDYSGMEKLRAEKLVLEDTEGKVFGIKGAAIEFDAYVADGKKFLVEVKGYTDVDDVLNFHRKAVFAESKIGEITKVIITPAIEKSALKRCKELGIQVHTFSIVD